MCKLVSFMGHPELLTLAVTVAGFVASDVGRSQCTVCGNGRWAKANSTSCFDCPLGGVECLGGRAQLRHGEGWCSCMWALSGVRDSRPCQLFRLLVRERGARQFDG